MNTTSGQRRSPWAAAVLAAVLVAGCSENRAGSILVPTGLRPLPDSLTGVLTGRVRFDPANAPDLAASPFPPTFVDVLSGTAVVRSDTLGGDRATFRFEGLPPGDFRLALRSRTFLPQTSASYRVVDRVQFTDDVVLLVDPAAVSQTLGVVGTMPGYGPDFVFDNAMDLVALGLWTYPNLFAPAPDVPAGTWRVKLATDVSIPGAFIGWGGDSSIVHSAPFTHLPVSFGTGPARDLKIAFPTTGTWQFLLDERRQTLSVQPYTPPLAARSTR